MNLKSAVWWRRIWRKEVRDGRSVWAQAPGSSHPGPPLLKDLSLLGGLDNNSISGVVELPGNDAQKFGLVLVAVVIGGADTYELFKLPSV